MSKKVLLSALLIGVIYVFLTAYIADRSLGGGIFWPQEVNLITLLSRLWASTTPIGFSMLIVVAFLTGLNSALLMKRFLLLGSLKSLHFVAGGGSVLGFVGTSCAMAVCGLPVISVLGLGGSLTFLPLHGQEFSYIALLLLVVSLYFLLNKTKHKKAAQVLKINKA